MRGVPIPEIVENVAALSLAPTNTASSATRGYATHIAACSVTLASTITHTITRMTTRMVTRTITRTITD